MRAARYHGQRDIRVDEVPHPEPGPGQVLISVEWCGICGSDLHEYLRGPYVIPREGHPHPFTSSVLPVTMGHEFCGRVMHSPPGSASNLKVGQAVMVDPRLCCGSCANCQSLNTNGCAKWGFLGLSGSGGGLSETVAVDASMCHALPESVPLDLAALIEPLSVAQHAAVCAGIKDWSKLSVLCVGGGPVAIAVVMILRARGVHKVIVSEPTAKRREHAVEIADVAIDPVKESVGERCRSLTGGKGVDVVFDCAGIRVGLEAGMEALKFGGTYVNVAGWETPFVMPQAAFMLKEITVKGSLSYTHEDFRQVVEAFKEGKFAGMSKMVTSRIALEDVVQKGFEELVCNKDDHIKILVTPRHENLTQLSQERERICKVAACCVSSLYSSMTPVPLKLDPYALPH